MSNLPLDQVERAVGSKYTAVVAVAKRALDAARRFLTLRASRRNPIAWAMQEILSGRVQVEVPTVEEATALSMRPSAAERLRVGFIHEEDLELEAERMGLHRELAPEAAEEEEVEAEEQLEEELAATEETAEEPQEESVEEEEQLKELLGDEELETEEAEEEKAEEEPE
jgi:DNA-directed RNA polymerase subunit K/omega